MTEPESLGPQYEDLKAGYAAVEAGDPGEARERFLAASKGDSASWAEQARGELRYLPKPAWGEVYLQGYGWVRFTALQYRLSLVPAEDDGV